MLFFSLLILENAYNAVQDILSVYGLAMSTTDIMDAFNKKADAAAAAVSIRDLATSCEYLIVYILHFDSRCTHISPFQTIQSIFVFHL